MRVFHKLFNTKATSVDDAKRSVTFVISTNKEDRYGDVVDQNSWDFRAYKKNPLVLWGHDPSEPENVLGTAKDLAISDDGSETTATLSFDTDINPKADLIWNQIVRGTLRTVSVGFRNHTFEWEDDTPVLKDNELFEISVVPIPANAGAVAKEFKAGNINEKDARWLIAGMRKEAELLDNQIKQLPKTKEKSMTDEQATALIDSVAKLTETVTAQDAKIAELTEKLPTPETPEEKQAREAKEADDAAAAKKAQEDANVAAGLNPDGSAKSGEDDQDGAEKEEIDEDRELTPEEEAEAREALGLPAAADE